MSVRRATSADVAREAGVSRATVSYVLNDAPGGRVAAPTRARVLAAAARLGYAPSLAGRALANGHSDIVLLALPDVPSGELMPRFVDALTRALAEHGLTLVAHFDVPSAPPLPRLAAMLSARAVVTLFPLADADIRAMADAGVPVVPAGDGLSVAELSRRQGRLQVAHLAERGHAVLAYALPADPRLALFADPRHDGVRAACAERGLPEPVAFTVPDDPAAVAAVVGDLIARAPRVTAVCAYNDEVALALLHGLRVLGVAVPGRVALVGVDGIALSAFSAPPLTTVTVAPGAAAAHLATAAVALLTGAPATPPPAEDILHLTARATT